jgi:hypothetical protein
VVFQSCHIGVTRVLKRCYKGACASPGSNFTLLHDKGVARVLQGCYKCYKRVTRAVEGCHKGSRRVSHGQHKGVTGPGLGSLLDSRPIA